MATVGNFRLFSGKMFRIVRRIAYDRKKRPSGKFEREFFIKSEAQARAKKLRQQGKKTRIVKSRNVKRYGGDIAYFLFEEMD